eukprot:TRINITY_DN13932_c0_g1_i1.p1 TRINITY_DN13932_c0_g1~~TRINITY_DN13932_c0_g1_i1.p1  ORF type:complete len:322 (+),score=94.36 TRINITY_DN13932_c0_g1_i1:53-1018(+)
MAAVVAGPQDPSTDAKTHLNQFCQRYCSRPITKTDIVYSTTKFGSNQYQAIVKLNCLEGQEYAGHLAANPKEAEKSAAAQAMQAYAPVLASLSDQQKSKKKKSSAGGKKEKIPDDENPAMTPKVRLNALCMKINKRALEKGETVYETRQMGLSKAPAGFQATVQLPCLPGDWSNKMFAGEVVQNKQGAEQSAAGIALTAMMADKELMALSEVTNERKKGGGGKGKGKGKGWKGWWGFSPSGPDLPREDLSKGMSGTVVEWKETFGWVKLADTIEHPAAQRREGKVYIHKKDLKGGKENLAEGDIIKLDVYVDASGLGGVEA